MSAFTREIRRSRHRTTDCLVAAVLTVALAGCGWRARPCAEEDATLNGRPTTKITFTGGPEPVEVHVAAEGPPYLLKITERGGVVWTFSDIDKPYRTSAPADALDEDELPEELVAAWG